MGGWGQGVGCDLSERAIPKYPVEGLSSSLSILLALTQRQTRFCSIQDSALISIPLNPQQHLGAQELANQQHSP